MSKTADGADAHDWFEGNTWFEQSYNPYAHRRRSPAKRLSDTLANLSSHPRHSFRGPDTHRLVSRSPSPTPLPYKQPPCCPAENPQDPSRLPQARRHLGLSPSTDQPDHPWPKLRAVLREPLAEFWGTFILVLFGDGAIAQVLLSANQTSAPGGHGFGDWNSITWAWGLGLMLGSYVAGDSGAYLNPAATVANCLLRKLPWRRAPVYIAAQVAGGFAAALVVYANYVVAVDQFEGGARTVPPAPRATAGIFATYPQPFMTGGGRFGSEFLASAVLMFVIFALKDEGHNGVARGGGNWLPLALCFLMLGIGSAFGWETGFAINLARDFGPRVLSSMVGYEGAWSAGGYYFWVPMLAPFLGCATGGILYDLFIYTGPSPINTKWLGLYDLLHPKEAVRHRMAEHKQQDMV